MTTPISSPRQHASNPVLSGIAQIQSSLSSTVTTGATGIPADNTIPQSNEGVELYTVTVTPKNANSTLLMFAQMQTTGGSSGRHVLALFRDDETDAFHAAARQASSSSLQHMLTHCLVPAGSTATRTYKMRAGLAAGTLTFNGESAAGMYGGVLSSGLTIIEIPPLD